jgi:hypothetical protein
MHIAIARFGTVPAERDKDFRDWFTRSNDQLRAVAGLRSRRLLRAPDGSYTALVEHDGASTFAAMRAAEAVSMIREGLGQILNDVPQAMTYEVVADFSPAKKCCGDDPGTNRREGATQAHPSGARCHGDRPNGDDGSDDGRSESRRWGRPSPLID